MFQTQENIKILSGEQQETKQQFLEKLLSQLLSQNQKVDCTPYISYILQNLNEKQNHTTQKHILDIIYTLTVKNPKLLENQQKNIKDQINKLMNSENKSLLSNLKLTQDMLNHTYKEKEYSYVNDDQNDTLQIIQKSNLKENVQDLFEQNVSSLTNFTNEFLNEVNDLKNVEISQISVSNRDTSFQFEQTELLKKLAKIIQQQNKIITHFYKQEQIQKYKIKELEIRINECDQKFSQYEEYQQKQDIENSYQNIKQAYYFQKEQQQQRNLFLSPQSKQKDYSIIKKVQSPFKDASFVQAINKKFLKESLNLSCSIKKANFQFSDTNIFDINKELKESLEQNNSIYLSKILLKFLNQNMIKNINHHLYQKLLTRLEKMLKLDQSIDLVLQFVCAWVEQSRQEFQINFLQNLLQVLYKFKIDSVNLLSGNQKKLNSIIDQTILSLEQQQIIIQNN